MRRLRHRGKTAILRRAKHPSRITISELKLLRFLANPLPSVLHVPRLRVRVSDAQAQRKLPIQLCMREKQISAPIQAIHNGLIRRIPALVAEADQV